MSDIRSSIQRSFRSLISTTPYSKITVSDICNGAHVSRKSFYAHYKNKDDVISSIFKQDVIDPIHSINAIFSSEQAEDLYLLCYEKIYQEIYQQADFYKKLVLSMKGHDDTFLRIATDAIYQLNSDILTSNEYSGDERRADYVSYFFAASQAMLIQKWIIDGMPYTPKELGELYDEMTRKFWLTTFGR